MVKHILFWTLKPEHKKDVQEIVSELNGKFQKIMPQITGLLKAEVGGFDKLDQIN